MSDIKQMTIQPLLPGITSDSCPPVVVCDAHAAMRKARRRALWRDAVQVALLLGVDALFIRWPESRLPFAGRAQSLMLLSFMNVAIGAHVWLARTLPRWRARLVAATWSRSERDKFTARRRVPSRS
jgi:hypothetical protein